jgi:hypothetical protein
MKSSIPAPARAPSLGGTSEDQRDRERSGWLEPENARLTPESQPAQYRSHATWQGGTYQGGFMKATVRVSIALAIAVGLAAFAAVGGATAKGVTPEQLIAAGWTCFLDPGAPRTVCSDPGHGRPVPGDPNAPPTYNFKIFTLDGSFIGTVHLIRADLYQGQPCPPTGAPYFFIPPIGYYRCEHF